MFSDRIEMDGGMERVKRLKYFLYHFDSIIVEDMIFFCRLNLSSNTQQQQKNKIENHP